MRGKLVCLVWWHDNRCSPQHPAHHHTSFLNRSRHIHCMKFWKLCAINLLPGDIWPKTRVAAATYNSRGSVLKIAYSTLWLMLSVHMRMYSQHLAPRVARLRSHTARLFCIIRSNTLESVCGMLCSFWLTSHLVRQKHSQMFAVTYSDYVLDLVTCSTHQDIHTFKYSVPISQLMCNWNIPLSTWSFDFCCCQSWNIFKIWSKSKIWSLLH